MTLDIAVNLTDPMFEGIYHGKRRHQSDLEAIVQRAKDARVERILITGTSLAESGEALKLAKRFSKLKEPRIVISGTIPHRS